MSLLERDSVLVSTTENGDPIVDLPFTRVNNVEGIGRSPNTTYSVGDVVYTDNNMQVALKCTTAGTTSNTELDISGNNIGDTVTDGTVVWQVVSRDIVATINQERPVKTFMSVYQFGLDNTCTIEEIANAMPDFSTLITNGDTNNFLNLGLPENGVLVVEKVYTTGVRFWLLSGNNATKINTYVGHYMSWATPKFTGWKKLATNGALSMPSNNTITIDGGTAGTWYNKYIAPCDGWLTIRANAPNIDLLLNGRYFTGVLCAVVNNTSNTILSMPLARGQEGGWYVGGTDSTITASFTYAQSEV